MDLKQQHLMTQWSTMQFTSWLMYRRDSPLTRLELYTAALAAASNCDFQKDVFGTEVLPVLYGKQEYDRNFVKSIALERIRQPKL
jgi:hypothetical protein